MSTWQIIALIYGIISIITFLLGVCAFFYYGLKEKRWSWMFLLVGVFFVPIMIFYILSECHIDLWKDGGPIRHYRKKREKKLKDRLEKEEYNRIRSAYERGELRRDELPRALDGKSHFEVYGKLLSGDEWRDLVYIENEYNNVLNDFFRRHPVIHLEYDIHVIYLPVCVKGLTNEDVLRYWDPGSDGRLEKPVGIDTSSLLDDLCYPEDATKLCHGLISCFGWSENHGAKYFHTTYYPLTEGDDDFIMWQIEYYARAAFRRNTGGFNKTIKRPSKDAPHTENFADEQFEREIEELVDEIRERVEKLEQRGISRKILMEFLAEEQKLSRLVITKDLCIILPDYNDMEIKMEPLNKAIYLLFLKHPEGIIFKHLPDFRKELADIYQKIKPMGLNDRALRSIDDVTDPYSNSINEKCARIRGSFISQFDDNIAKHYYIYGLRGEPKKIDLPRDLVVWE